MPDPATTNAPITLARTSHLRRITTPAACPPSSRSTFGRSAAYREVYLDGRPLLKHPNPTWNGYSTGHWEGDTLVIETNGIRDDMWLDIQGSPITESAHLTERLKRLSSEVELRAPQPCHVDASRMETGFVEGWRRRQGEGRASAQLPNRRLRERHPGCQRQSPVYRHDQGHRSRDWGRRRSVAVIHERRLRPARTSSSERHSRTGSRCPDTFRCTTGSRCCISGSSPDGLPCLPFSRRRDKSPKHL